MAAGESARAEYERRKAKDEARTRAAWGRFGGIAVALTPERQSTRAWASGADGEERVGARLDHLAGAGVRILHDRRVPGTRANIDHIAVTSAGVWVIDTKRYADQSPEKRVEGGLLRPRVERLWVRGDRTRLVEAVLGQVDKVAVVVPAAPVRGALCFIDAQWGLLADPFTVNDVLVTWPKNLVKRLSTESGGVDVDAVAAQLERRFAPR